VWTSTIAIITHFWELFPIK